VSRATSSQTPLEPPVTGAFTIASAKLPDLDAAERIVAGTARSMGIEVVDPG
jgi:ribosomal protein L11